MKTIKQFTQCMRDKVFRRLEAPRSHYERTMINNLDSLYRVIRKGDVLLVEGDSQFSRMIKLFTQSTWSHCALFVGDALISRQDAQPEMVLNRFGNEDAHHLIVDLIIKRCGLKRFSIVVI